MDREREGKGGGTMRVRQVMGGGGGDSKGDNF